MIFKVGIESPASKNEAWGIIVPIFDKLGYGCISAADDRKDLKKHATEAIETMIEEVIRDGKTLAELLALTEDDYQAQYPEFTEWFDLDIKISSLKTS